MKRMKHPQNRHKSLSRKLITNIAFAGGIGFSSTLLLATLVVLLFFNDISTLVKNQTVEKSLHKAIALESDFQAALSEGIDITALSKHHFDSKDLLDILITKPTKDDRYVSKMHEIPLLIFQDTPSESFSEILQNEGNNLFQQARLEYTVDPAIYSQGKHSWQNVYFPLVISSANKSQNNESLFIVRASVSVSSTKALLQKYRSHFYKSVSLLFLISALAFTALIAYALFFFKGIKLFFAKMETLVQEAVSGSSYKTISKADEDFAPIAQSFNTLIKNIQQKEEELDKAREQNQLNLDTLFKQGVSLLKEKKLAEAEHMFKAIVSIKQSSFGSWFNLGVIYARQLRYDEALKMFEEALAINPDDKLSKTYKNKIRRQLEQHAANERIS